MTRLHGIKKGRARQMRALCATHGIGPEVPPVTDKLTYETCAYLMRQVIENKKKLQIRPRVKEKYAT